jgi:hypothetical protein
MPAMPDPAAHGTPLQIAVQVKNSIVTVSHFGACIGSPCLRQCVHGASIGGLQHLAGRAPRESKRLVVESPWSLFASECRRCGHPPRLAKWPCWRRTITPVGRASTPTRSTTASTYLLPAPPVAESPRSDHVPGLTASCLCCARPRMIRMLWRRYTILLHVSLGLQKLHDMGDFPSLVGAVLTENRLCHACSSQDKVRMVAYSD